MKKSITHKRLGSCSVFSTRDYTQIFKIVNGVLYDGCGFNYDQDGELPSVWSPCVFFLSEEIRNLAIKEFSTGYQVSVVNDETAQDLLKACVGYSFNVESMEWEKGEGAILSKMLFNALSNVCISNDGWIDEDWLIFKKGTDREYIWHWLESKFDISVAQLMFETP